MVSQLRNQFSEMAASSFEDHGNMSDLSDFDRGRRRKKKIMKKPEREQDLMSGKAPIILTKPTIEKLSTVRASSAETVGQVQAPAMPTRILRSREDDRSLSSPSLMVASTPTSTITLPSSASLTVEDNLQQQQQGAGIMPVSKIQIQQKTPATSPFVSAASVTAVESRGPSSEGTSSLSTRLAPYPEMKGSVKLIDEALQFCDLTSEFLQDQSDFLVVGVLGLQGVGKSTVLSLLANHSGSTLPSYKNSVFKLQTRDQRELGVHCTRGMDIFISNHRTILLDMQPILSHSVLDHMIQFEKFPGEYGSTENALEIQSLQIAGFLMTVCHVVILVQDWFTDSNLLRFVQAAEMLRPSSLLQSHDNADEVVDYYPHFMFVHNKCSPSDFEPMKVKSVQQTYAKMFEKSKLNFKGPIGSASGSTVNCGESFNLFLLPWSLDKCSADTDSSMQKLLYKGPCLDHLAKTFRHQVHSMPRHQLLHTTLNEKNWFHYAARTWENVKKSGLYMEYCRLLT